MAAFTPRHGAATPARGSIAESAPGTAYRGAGAASPAYSDNLDESFSHFDDHMLDDGRERGGPSPGANDEASRNFKVVIRVRPPLPRELHGERPFQNTVKVGNENTIVISENIAAYEESGGTGVGPYSTHTFTFDHVYDQNCDQRSVYETTAQAVVESSLKGYNATILAYGQTGTGKTYTMEGFNSAEERGIIPRAIEQIFRHIGSSVSPRMRFLVRASYLQIYNEVISDLLKPERSNLAIREDKKRGVFVEGLSEWVVRSPAEIYGLMERGGAVRATGSTKLNEISSRSHAVFMIITEQSETLYVDDSGNEMTVEDFHRLVKQRVSAAGGNTEAGLKALEANVRQSFKVGKLNLVDLAGSERVRLTGATGQRLEESKKINQSLSALGNVIAALTDPRGRQHIPYRDSKLTRILEDSLGGNCKTTMMAMISPALESFQESLSTLKFANRAKSIRNEARVNEDVDQKSLLRQYERELKRLRTELEERSRIVVDQRRLLQLEEERRRAEEDKMAAIRALEARSREFMREKAEKKRLEDEINRLQESVLQGGLVDKLKGGGAGVGAAPGTPGGPAGNGAAVQDTPAFRNALKEHQERIRAEYEARLAELEKERESIEEEKAQVDRYKQLLLKQRDIMILLTQRLNERDEQIVALQDELDAYDRHQRELEEKLDEKTAALIHLQRVTMEHNAASPVKNSELVEALGDWAGGGNTGSATLRARLQEAAGPAGSGGSVPASLLVTTKQYRPHSISASPTSSTDGDALSSSSTASSPATGGSLLLSAEEKISELGRLVENLKGDRDRLVRDLEDTQAEKVSMEYLLREKLEKLVQSEIEARLAAYKKNGGGGDTAAMAGLASASATSSAPASSAAAVRQLQSDLSARTEELATIKAENARADEEVKRLRRKLQQLSEQQQQQQGGSGSEDAATVAQLRDKLAVHEKERRAIHTIMEHKIKALVDAIASAANASPPSGAAPPTPGGASGSSNSRLMREVQALQRLVNASIAALRNSETAPSDSSSSSSVAAPPATPATGAVASRGGNSTATLQLPSTPTAQAGVPRPALPVATTAPASRPVQPTPAVGIKR